MTQISTGKTPLYLFILATSTIVVGGIILQDITFLGSYFLLLIFGLFLFKNISKQLFIISFSINVIFSTILIFYYLSTYNFPFGSQLGIGPGDDMGFYQLVYTKFIGAELPIEYILSSTYKFFIEGHAYFLNFLSLIGISIDNTSGVFHGYLLNVAVGATIPPCIYMFGKMHFNEKVGYKAGILCSIFPALIYFSAAYLRDIWVAALFIWATYFFLHKTLKFYTKLSIGIALTLVNIVGLRTSTGIVSFIPLIAPYIFTKKNSKLIFWGLTLAIVLGQTATKQYQNDLLNVNTQAATSAYTELAVATSGEKSLGVKLLASNNPASKAVSYIVGLFNPVPPFPIASLDSIFIGIGAVFWYFIVPIAIIGLYKPKENYILLSFAILLTIIVNLSAVSAALGSFRHRLLMTPLIILMFSYMQIERRVEFNTIIKKVSLVYAFFVMLYMMLKLFLV